MTIEEFKEHISNFPNGHMFDYGISEPFSWRGIYAEVAFSVIKSPMYKEEILENIDKSMEGTFIGWKGGEYRYYPDTEVHFERERRGYTDGQYCQQIIEDIQGIEEPLDIETKMVKVAFA